MAKDAYDAQKAPIDALVAELATAGHRLAARRRTSRPAWPTCRNYAYRRTARTGGIGKYRPWTCPAEYLPTKGYKAAAFACEPGRQALRVGRGRTELYDCSGLTLAAWKQVGVYLPHNAAASAVDAYVSRADIQIGDLVFYYSDIHHVAIYVGDGKVMTRRRPATSSGWRIWTMAHPQHRPAGVAGAQAGVESDLRTAGPTSVPSSSIARITWWCGTVPTLSWARKRSCPNRAGAAGRSSP